jgi:hypothetical protein
MGDNEYCPYCGTHRLGKEYGTIENKKPMPTIIPMPTREKKVKQPIFSEEECFLYGIHPDDELYRKFMELDILSKDYRK